MILVDAGVLIDFLRTGDAKLDRLFRTSPVGVCGVTRAEILAGARRPGERQRLTQFLGTFQQDSIPGSLWDRIGDTLAVLLAQGLTVPFPDAVIATVGTANGFEVWARDPHFTAIQKFLPQLILFQEPP